MPTLPVQSFAVTVQTAIAGIQGRASKLINFAIGSTLRAIAEGFAGVFLWFQAMVLQVLLATRLSTSTGTDVDTFTVDFMPALPGTVTATLPKGSPRLGAKPASGTVTFSRFTASPSALFIPVGATVQSNDGNNIFTVLADPTLPTFSAVAQGYTLPANTSAIAVPVINTTPGSAGNVAVGTISVITSALTGIDQVINNTAFTNGADFESDDSLKVRFSNYILGLSRGDLFGLVASLEGAALDSQFTITEGYNYDGSYRPGYFFVVADDGSGTPGPTFINAMMAAADAVRPLSIQMDVFSPVILFATVAMQITTAQGFDHNTVVAQVAAVIAHSINALGLGVDLQYSMIPGWAYSVAGVTRVSAITLNQKAGDLATIVTSRPTLDGKSSIVYATVKAQSVIVS
jgi:phage-related baseplate assembly protein